MSAEASVETLLAAIESDLQTAADLLDPIRYPELHEMVAFHLGWRGEPGRGHGKRLRPLITLLACQAAGGRWQAAVPAASAVELIHNFSLIHDDIEDRSDTRRGRPTLWSRWGVPQALNAGDAVFALARLAANRLLDGGISSETVLEVHGRLDRACLHLTQGQHLDLAFEGRAAVSDAEYLEMVEGKTAGLLAAAAAVGACIAGAAADAVEAYHAFGRHLGLAFQAQDDLLGIWGQPEVTGKPSGDDLRSRKKTLPVLYGLQRSPDFAALWSSPPDDDTAVRAMAGLLDEVGARQEVQATAEGHTRQALAALAGAARASPATAELERLALGLVGRMR